MAISELKKEVKIKLTGKWGKAIILTIVYTIIVGILEMIGEAINNQALKALYQLVIIVINVPFSYGFVASLIKLSRGEDVNFTDFITLGLQSFGKVWAVVGRTIQKLILPIILIIVGIVVFFIGLIQGFAMQNETAAMMIPIGALIILLAYIYYIVKALSYQLTSYVLYDNPDLTGKEIVEKSEELMTGNKWNYIFMILSFIAWYLLIGLIVYISNLLVSTSIAFVLIALVGIIAIAFYLSPYISFTIISFYEDLNGTVSPKNKTPEENNPINE